ncbi:MAG: hypothetical protein DCF22_04150 [Leptolyngbya sp.]|nr:MAG: hypothetical protein DCF22_04150 [Leptolyngbya sp.]
MTPSQFSWVQHSSKSESPYQIAFNQSSDGILLLQTKTQQVLDINVALQELLGYTDQELSRLSLTDLVDETQFPHGLNIQQTADQRHQSLGFVDFRCRNGTLLKAMVTVSFANYQGQSICCFVVQKEFPPESPQLKDNFLSTVSHELRTPITTIKMAIQMLTLALSREGLLAPDSSKSSLEANKIAHYLKILNDECNREIGLITDLLDLQRLEAETQTIAAQPIQLEGYLHRIVRPFQDQAASQHKTLNVAIFSGLPDLMSDSQSLERILVELLTNACKYTPAGETIAFRAGLREGHTRSPKTVFISVINSGVEIRPNQLEQIFDKFYRIPTNDPHRHGGTGLGLALVKKLVLNLSGTIYAESSNGQTCFTVELPVIQAAEPLAF